MSPSLSLSDLLLCLPSLPSTNKRQSALPPPLPLSLKSISKPTNLRLPAIAINTPLSDPTTSSTPNETQETGALTSCFPSLAWANTLYFKSRYYNVQVLVADDEPEDSLLRRFKREVMKAGILQECRRRQFFENKHEKKKRKARDAARRNRRRPYQPRAKWNNREASKEKKEEKAAEEEDNWELPEGELPY